jgi:asparagine synthase (glutamine-hydrolysing)
MCGISGVVNFKGVTELEKVKVRNLTHALEHRGPDNEGFHDGTHHFFGHRRLSILDLSAEANQPFISDFGVSLVFNGEIYNYKELRKKLESKHHFSTKNSDTEVIILAYLEWGIEFIEKLNGMFAIALFDKNKQKLFLIRDRIGQKPLYYYQSENNSLFFSSEIHGFFTANIAKKSICSEAIYNYLTVLTTPAPKTFFKNIFKLEAGTYIEHNKQGSTKKTYWDIASFLNEKSSDSFEEAIPKTESLLKNSMVYRNISDVPISLALSGGLDSCFFSISLKP